jgi:hypothetical protein
MYDYIHRAGKRNSFSEQRQFEFRANQEHSIVSWGGDGSGFLSSMNTFDNGTGDMKK